MPASQPLAGPPAASMNQPLLVAVLILLLGLAGTATLAWRQASQNEQFIRQQLFTQATILREQTTALVTLYQYGLRGMRGVVLTAGSALSAKVVHDYMQTRSLTEEFAGAHGFGFIRRVRLADEAAFLQQARAEQADFHIRQLNAHRRDRFVIQYLEPQPRNRAALGLDIASEPHRRQAAIQAMRTGNPQLTAPITLVQASGKAQQSFLFLLPIYRDWRTPDNAAARDEALIGWSYAPLIMTEMLTGLQVNTETLSLTITDVTTAPIQFYQHGSALADGPVAELEHQVFGRIWRWQLRPTAAFVTALALPSVQMIWLSGVFITLLLLLSQFNVWRFVQSRRQLFDQRSRLAAIVQSSNDGIIGKDLRGVVTSWNQGAEMIFGYTAEEAVGQTLASLIVPSHLLAEEQRILQQLAQGQGVKQFVTQRLHKKGKLLDVLVNVSPIYDEKGNIIAAAKTVRDIGELVASRRQLDQALRQYKTLLDTINTQFLYAETDPDGRILDVNSVFCHSHGYQRAELIGQTHRLLSSGRHPPLFWQQLWASIGQKQAWRGEICNHSKQGTERWYDTVIMPLLTANGQIDRYIALSSDITDRKEAEAHRSRLHQLIETVLSAASEVAIISLDTAGKIVLFNRGAEQMLGYRSHVATSMDWLVLLNAGQCCQRLADLSLPEDDPQYLLRHVAATGAPETWRTELSCEDGNQLPVLLTLTAIRDNDCQLLGYLLIALDFSEQLQSQADLAVMRDQLDIAASVAELGVWSWQPAADKLWWNDRMFDIYQQPASLAQAGLSYQHWRERIHPDDLVSTEQALQSALRGEIEFCPVFRLLLPERGVRYILAGATVEFDTDGQPWRVTGINLDITEQRELEQQLRLAKEQADAANQAKSQFLANMSHEIRTPLNAVLGLLQLLQQTPLNDLQGDYVAKSQLAARSLLSLLNNILDFSKIDAGKLELDPAPLALDEFFRQLAVLLGATHQNRQVELLFELDPALPQQVLADALRLQQILLNLGGNALKFTERGSVLIRVEVQQLSQSNATLLFSVIDSGIGISAAQRSRLFSAFSQAEVSISRRYGGSGLGLAICQRLLTLMGSQLQLNSEPGAGSVFSFVLQLPVLAATRAESLPAGLRLLLVDDQPLVRRSLSAVLEQAGARVDICADGYAAISAVQTARQQGHPYQLVLLDWQMPGLDGLATARQLQLEQPDAPQLLMVTAFENDVLRELCTQEPIPLADVLIKPVTPGVLLTAVRQAISVGPVPQSASQERAQPLAGLHILLVEDNALNRLVAEQLLMHAGARVSQAFDGAMAVSLVQQQRFDVVLMDLQMPGMDGLTACRYIRTLPDAGRIPILAMTANATAEDKQNCLAAGMNGHLSKPIDLPVLLQQILACTQHTAPAGQSALSHHATLAAAAGEQALLAPLSEVLARFAGNQQLLTQSLVQYRQQWQSGYQALCHDADVIRQRAILHDLQGVAATLGFTQLASALREAGLEFKVGKTPDLPALDVLAGRSFSALQACLPQYQLPVVAAKLEPAQLTTLLNQLAMALERQQMAALDFAAALPAEPAEFQHLRALVEQLAFEPALHLVKQLQGSASDG